MLNTVYANAPQFQDLINAIQGGDTSAIATALGQIKTSVDSITTALGSLSTDVTQDATQWTNLINAISSGGGGGTIDIDATQWTNLLTSIDKGDTSALATALGLIKSSVDTINTSLGSLSVGVSQNATQWSNLLTEIAKGDTTAVITALGNINVALGNIYTALGSLSINPTQWGNLITALSTQRLIMQDSTQWANLVNAIANQSLTVDLSNVTSSVVSNLSNVTGSTITDALNTLNSFLTNIQTVSAQYLITNISTVSNIYAYKLGKILFISGYFSSFQSVPNGTNIASIDGSPLFGTYTSIINDTLTKGIRLVLRPSGIIETESIIDANHWQSFSFVTLVN